VADWPSGGAERLVLLAPIEPARTGNGLAMRTELFRHAGALGLSVQTVVVPVAGRVHADVPRSAEFVTVPMAAELAQAGVRALLGAAAWRARLARAETLPHLARAASPGLAEAVTQVCAGRGRAALHVMRSYLAPLGIAVAERLDAAWVTLDLDDDDARLAADFGDQSVAAAYDRMVAVFGPLFDGLCAASLAEAEAISARHGLTVEQIPNAVELPGPPRRPGEPDRRRHVSLLFVGNLTYQPNVEAAGWLVEEILPRVRARLDRPVTVVLAGPHHAELGPRLSREGVELTGFVPHLESLYAHADAVVVPLTLGGGTRIKLLEAFAYGVPVVASSAAAAGLEVSNRRHLLLADDPDQAAAAVEEIVTDRALAAGLAAQAHRLVRDRYSTAVVEPEIREFFARAALRAGARVPPSGTAAP
jgi:glycosyltransferase involved in cell wall biosynthesis